MCDKDKSRKLSLESVHWCEVNHGQMSGVR